MGQLLVRAAATDNDDPRPPVDDHVALHIPPRQQRQRAPPPLPWFHAVAHLSPLSPRRSWLSRISLTRHPAFSGAELPGSWVPDPFLAVDGANTTTLSPGLAIDGFPGDVHLAILNYLDLDEYLNLALTSRYWFLLAHDASARYRASLRWYSLPPSFPSSSWSPLADSTSKHHHHNRQYAGIALDRCTNRFEPYPMHLSLRSRLHSLPPSPFTCGTCEWPTLGGGTASRLTDMHCADLSHRERTRIPRSIRSMHAVAVSWVESESAADLAMNNHSRDTMTTGGGDVGGPAPLAAVVAVPLSFPTVYRAIAVGPWIVGTFEPVDSGLGGAFVVLATRLNRVPSPPNVEPPEHSNPVPVGHRKRSKPTFIQRRLAGFTRPNSTVPRSIALVGLLANPHAPALLPAIRIDLTRHCPPLDRLPFQTILRRPGPGGVDISGRITISVGVGSFGTTGNGSQGRGTPPGDGERSKLHDDACCVSLSVAGWIRSPNEVHLYASLDDWNRQETERTEAAAAAAAAALVDVDVNESHGQGGSRRGSVSDHRRASTAAAAAASSAALMASEWARTYAPLLDRITLHMVGLDDGNARDRVVGWWKHPTLSVFFAEVEG